MPLAADLDTTVQNFADKRHVLVCLDFDGAVAELVADAMAATPVPVNAEAVERLSDLKGVDLAYVSGRPLDTLRQLAAPPAGTLLVGSHGAEKDLGPDYPGLDLDSAQQRAQARTFAGPGRHRRSARRRMAGAQAGRRGHPRAPHRRRCAG